MNIASAVFSDLRQRVISAAVMATVGLGCVYIGGAVFSAMLAVCAGLMVWEMGRMAAPDSRQALLVGLPVLAAATVAWVGFGNGAQFALLPLAPLVGLIFLKQNRAIFAAYSMAILLAVAAIYVFRTNIGLVFTLWLIVVVIAADVGGYFAGRLIGGPKIYPKISPKKTWSGTVGGLVLAALVGATFGLGAGVVLLSVLAAAASQFGDVAESAIKRHTGVKDSSALIPGHGGLLDRFDGLIGAALFVLIYDVVFSAPLPGAG